MGLNGPGTIHGSGTGFSNYWSADWFWNIGLSQLVYGLDKGALVTQWVAQGRRKLNFIS